MEQNTVILSLKTYEEMKSKIDQLISQLAVQNMRILELENRKIFKCEETWSDNLSLALTYEGEEQLTKDFSEFKDTYFIDSKSKELVYFFAKSIPKTEEIVVDTEKPLF